MSYQRKANVTNRWWVKMWADDILNGSIMSQGTLEDLGFMTAMVCLATKCRGDYGWIQANPECAFSHQWIANRITSGNLEQFEKLLARAIAEERVSETEGRGIFINNMEYYQVIKGVPDKKNNGSKPSDDKMPLNDDEKEAQERLFARKGAYKYPEDAQIGINRRGFEGHVKKNYKNKGGE